MSWAGRLVVVAVLGVALGGCGGGTKQSTTTETTPLPPTTTLARAYFLLHGRVQAVRREVPATTSLSDAVLAALIRGPSRREVELGFSTSVPSVAVWDTGRTTEGVLAVDIGSLRRPALAQVVYTLTQLAPSRAVYVNGKPYTRADFEDETPAILVESPLPFQNVTSPLRATGTANTFEATFEYELVDPDGKIVATHFVTATSGSGTRGTFDFTVPYTVDRGGLGELVVLERSAKDGSRIHIVEIPLRLAP